MRWLTLSSKVSRPGRRLRTRTSVKPRRKKKPPPPRPAAGERKPLGGVISVIILVLLAGGVWWYFQRARLFAVETIEVRNHHAYSPEEIIELAGLEPGGNIFPLDVAAARKEIIANRDFRDARVKKLFPGTVRIEVMEREPRARIHYGRLYTIDDQGVVLSPRKSRSERNLPVIRGLRVVDRSSDLHPPENRDASLELLRELESLEIESLIDIEEISLVSSGRIDLRAAGRLNIILARDDYREQLTRLRAVLENLGRDLPRAREIDLRYSRVPVKFQD